MSWGVAWPLSRQYGDAVCFSSSVMPRASMVRMPTGDVEVVKSVGPIAFTAPSTRPSAASAAAIVPPR